MNIKSNKEAIIFRVTNRKIKIDKDLHVFGMWDHQNGKQYGNASRKMLFIWKNGENLTWHFTRRQKKIYIKTMN